MLIFCEQYLPLPDSALSCLNPCIPPRKVSGKANAEKTKSWWSFSKNGRTYYACEKNIFLNSTSFDISTNFWAYYKK